MNKALHKVGIKRTSSQPTSVKDQKPAKQSTLAKDQPHSNGPPAVGGEALKRKVSPAPQVHPSDIEEEDEETENDQSFSEGDNESYDETGESEADYDDEDQEDETEIERYRRLAAAEAKNQKKANR